MRQRKRSLRRASRVAALGLAALLLVHCGADTLEKGESDASSAAVGTDAPDAALAADTPAAADAAQDATAAADAAAPDAASDSAADVAEVAAPDAASDSAADVADVAAPDADDAAVSDVEALDAAALDTTGSDSADADLSDTAAPADVADGGAVPADAGGDAQPLVDAQPLADVQPLADASTDATAADAGPAPPKKDPYDPDYMPKFELVVDAEAMAVLMDPSEATQKTWVHAAFICEGEVFADVGLRRKGASTYRVIPQKAAFKIKFNKWSKGVKFRGYHDLTLNNMVDDATGLRERLAYAVYAAVGVPAPKCNTATVTLNGEAYGPYANVETPDGQFLKARFGTNAGTLYEAEWGSEWLPGSEDGMSVDVGSPGKTDLTALFAAVEAATDANLLAGVKAHLDIEEWLKFSAIEAVTAARDNYGYGIWGSHNYFMAGGADGRFSLIPWSQDLTFSDENGLVDAAKPLSADPIDASETLLGRCKANPECWASFKTHVAGVLAVTQTMDIAALAAKWHAQIDVAQASDTKRESSINFYQASVPALYAWLAARPTLVKNQLGIP